MLNFQMDFLIYTSKMQLIVNCDDFTRGTHGNCFKHTDENSVLQLGFPTAHWKFCFYPHLGFPGILVGIWYC